MTEKKTTGDTDSADAGFAIIWLPQVWRYVWPLTSEPFAWRCVATWPSGFFLFQVSYFVFLCGLLHMPWGYLLFLKSVFGGLPYNSCGQCYEMYTWACHDVYDKEIMRWEGVSGYSGHWVLEHPSGMCFYSQTPQSRAYVTMLQGKRALKKKEIDKQQGK